MRSSGSAHFCCYHAQRTMSIITDQQLEATPSQFNHFFILTTVPNVYYCLALKISLILWLVLIRYSEAARPQAVTVETCMSRSMTPCNNDPIGNSRVRIPFGKLTGGFPCRQRWLYVSVSQNKVVSAPMCLYFYMFMVIQHILKIRKGNNESPGIWNKRLHFWLTIFRTVMPTRF